MTIEEIAKLAGVSRSTVSRVVNGDPHVREEVRAHVKKIIDENGYHPNAAARSLASRRTRIIGLLVPRSIGDVLTDPFFLHLIQGAVEECNATDYLLTMLLESPEGEISNRRVYDRVIRGRHVDGVVIASSVVEDPIVERLQHDGFPFVLVGRHPHHDVSFVDVDNVGAAKSAVQHLIGHGHRRIGCITGPPNMIAAIDRFAGYVTALQESGRALERSLTAEGDFTRRGGYRAMQEVLAAGARPDAMFVASDTMASGALQALRDAGLRTPGDVAVFGFDGLDHQLVSRPVLSTIIQPIHCLGQEAVRVLLHQIANPESAPVQRFLPTELALRVSCGCPAVEELAGVAAEGGVPA
jgi:LacI family transcriptional regulator